MIEYKTSGFDGLGNMARAQREESERIWESVRSGIQHLVDNGSVDPQVGPLLQARDAEFRQKAGLFDESVVDQQNAMNRVASIGQEGGGRMRRAAAGGA
ncbi:hypothetical protein ACL02R_02530 [Streptomyces sp. MS19]|uniref:hypothetical protein n=1 Tax=Streptomyces sp. MS19 TaxID=3385972 RepID=UPI0039A0AB75